MRDNEPKPKQERFRLVIRKTFFVLITLKQWNRLPREIAWSLYIEVFKIQPNKAMSNLV